MQHGTGSNGYIALDTRGGRAEVWADTSLQAQEIAAKVLRARRQSDVTVTLAVKGDKPVTHVAVD